MTGELPCCPNGSEALKTFAEGGYYSVFATRSPFRRARLIVLEDIFMSRKYATCGGKPDASAANAGEIAWLGPTTCSRAAGVKEAVWVIGTHPAGGRPLFDGPAKAEEMSAEARKPEMFLSSSALPETLAEYGDVVRLGIFAHTHMDEMRFLKPEVDGASPAARPGVPVKLVPSISPIDGNNPSFTVASIDPSTAILKDYRVFAASDSSGVGTSWQEEYDYAQSFHEASFSGRDVAQLMAGFEADRPDRRRPVKVTCGVILSAIFGSRSKHSGLNTYVRSRIRLPKHSVPARARTSDSRYEGVAFFIVVVERSLWAAWRNARMLMKEKTAGIR